MRHLKYALFILLLLQIGCRTRTAVPPDALVLVNGTVLVSAEAPVIPDGVVVIDGNHIFAVGQAGDFRLPSDVTLLDATNSTVMPGIINAHVHFAPDPSVRYRFLHNGVTSVCDLGTSLGLMRFFAHNATIKGEPVARGFGAGPMITACGGYPSQHVNRWAIEAETPAEAAAIVDDLVARGATMIKVVLDTCSPLDPAPVLTPAQLQAIVHTAHAYGLPVRAHVHTADMLARALDANVDTIEHLPLPFDLEFGAPQMLNVDNAHLATWPELEALYRRMATQGVILVPTLDAEYCTCDTLLHYSPRMLHNLDTLSCELVQAYQAMGGTIALGNDFGTPGVEHGMPLTEMQLLQHAGLTTREVIQAGTASAAAACGEDARLGTLEAGKLADVIIVEGDPLADLQALQNVRIAIVDGVVVDLGT